MLTRRIFSIRMAGAAAGILFAAAGIRAAPPPIVRITARKFVFEPSEILLKVGEPTVLEFMAQDAVMGFNAPDMKVRATLPPGQVVRVTVTAQKAGRIDFFCDVFCGSGHEEMYGYIIAS